MVTPLQATYSSVAFTSFVCYVLNSATSANRRLDVHGCSLLEVASISYCCFHISLVDGKSVPGMFTVEAAGCRSGRRFFGVVGSHRGGRPAQADHREWRVFRSETRNVRGRGSPLTTWAHSAPAVTQPCCDSCNERQ